VDSAPGRGSTFWFTVTAERCERKELKHVAARETPASPVATKEARTLRILVAEDNNINQTVISWMLAPLNCQFDMVPNGLEAVAAATRSTYDLVLMDIQMPELDGIAATKQIRSLGGALGQIPIIAMTANAMQGDREKYLDSGMTDYVAKPIDQRELLGAISRCADIAMPDIDDDALNAHLIAEQAETPLTEEAAEAVEDLMSDLDNLLDGTGR